jgi:hypothetical protein
MNMLKSLLILAAFFAACAGVASAQVSVRVEPSNLQGPQSLPEETGKAAIRDYLQAWQSFSAAFEQNRAALLDPDFVGIAKDKLTETIQQQAALGIRTHYTDRAHDIQTVFFSPEGLSIELLDTVNYDVEFIDNNRVKTTQHVSARYLIILTPAELRWRVRVFQAEPE